MNTLNQKNIYHRLLKGGAARKYRDIIASAVKDTINLNFPFNIESLDSETKDVIDTLHKDGLKIFESYLNADFLSSILKKLEKLELTFLDRTSGADIAKGSSLVHLDKYPHLLRPLQFI